MTTTTSIVIPRFTVGDRLRKARELTGLDQAAFGDAIGISRQSVSNYENGNTRARKIVLNAWQLRTGVPVEWLEFGRVSPVQDDGGTPLTRSPAIPGSIEPDPESRPTIAQLKALRKRIPLSPPVREPQMRNRPHRLAAVGAVITGLPHPQQMARSADVQYIAPLLRLAVAA